MPNRSTTCHPNSPFLFSPNCCVEARWQLVWRADTVELAGTGRHFIHGLADQLLASVVLYTTPGKDHRGH